MIIGSRQRLDVFSNNYLDVIIGEHSIERVQNKKVLGIIIDDQLKWDRHNDEQCKTISKSIALLKRARKCVHVFTPQCILRGVLPFMRSFRV